MTYMYIQHSWSLWRALKSIFCHLWPFDSTGHPLEMPRSWELVIFVSMTTQLLLLTHVHLVTIVISFIDQEELLLWLDDTRYVLHSHYMYVSRVMQTLAACIWIHTSRQTLNPWRTKLILCGLYNIYYPLYLIMYIINKSSMCYPHPQVPWCFQH